MKSVLDALKTEDGEKKASDEEAQRKTAVSEAEGTEMGEGTVRRTEASGSDCVKDLETGNGYARGNGSRNTYGSAVHAMTVENIVIEGCCSACETDGRRRGGLNQYCTGLC